MRWVWRALADNRFRLTGLCAICCVLSLAAVATYSSHPRWSLLTAFGVSVFSPDDFEAYVARRNRVRPQSVAGLHCYPASLALGFTPEYIAQWKERGRPTPLLSPPPHHDWAGAASPTLGADLERAKAETPGCGDQWRVALVHFKVVNRTVWTAESPAAFTSGQREVALDMLSASLFLYADFPDVDLFVNLADEPHACGLAVPFLQFAVIANVTESPPDADWRKATYSWPRYTRGFTVPTPDAWVTLSQPAAQLAAYARCLSDAFPWAHKAARVFWRGSDSGGDRSWYAPAADRPPAAAEAGGPKTYFESVLANKRVAATIVARHAPWMDVALSTLYRGRNGGDDPVTQLVHAATQLALQRDAAPLESWPASALTLSLDGAVSPWRLPRQYLLGSPVLRVVSLYRDWADAAFVAGVHYESLEYGLTDLLSKSKALAAEAAAEIAGAAAGAAPGRLRRMADAAAERGASVFHALAQVDAFMWGVLRAREAMPWTVAVPPGGGWTRLVLPSTHRVLSPGVPPSARARISRLRACWECPPQPVAA